jgi:outer membrane protein TolC
MPLYEGGAVRSRVREAKYGANQSYLNVLAARRAAREEAVRAWENLAAARAELTSRSAQVRAAEIARNGVRQEAEFGERTTLDALDADRDVRDAQIALITAKRNEVVAQFALASALGMLLPGNVGIEQPVFDFDSYAKGAAGRILSTGIDVEGEDGR